MKKTCFDVKVLEARQTHIAGETIVSEKEIERQADYFQESLENLNYSPITIADFMTEYYQNLNTTKDNLCDFMEYIKEQ